MSDNIHKIWIISGEESGDIYGERLIKQLRAVVPEGDILEVSAMGGRRIAAAGARILVDSTELGVVGIFEVIGMIRTFARVFTGLVRKASENPPDCVVLIDYPGFNLRFAAKLHKMGIPVIWYISPQVWAWKKGRIKKLAKYCRKMMLIFPFETEVYSGTGLDAVFVGHPLVEIVRERHDPGIKKDPNRILLLPGSRVNEIKRLFFPMLETAVALHKKHPEYKFAVSAPREKICKYLKNALAIFAEGRTNKEMPEIDISCGDAGRWMQEANAGLAASGTVTVECAIAGLPLVVVYKLNPMTFFIAKVLVGIDYFTMVNIICRNMVFEEFLQVDVAAPNLLAAMEKILPGGSRRKGVELAMEDMTEALSPGSGEGAGNASRQAAECIMRTLLAKGGDKA